jgi:outer membrane protein assembly factor BamB
LVAASNDDDFSGAWRVDPLTLEVQWSALGLYWPLVLGKGVIVMGEWNGGMAALRLTDGTVVWEATREVSRGGGLLWQGKARMADGRLLDIETGAECGSIHLDGLTPVGQRDDVWLLRDENSLCSFALPTMERRWTRDVLHEAESRFSVVGDKETRVGFVRGSAGEILVLGYAGALLGLSEKTGELLWHYRARVGHSVPEVHSGRLFGISGNSFLCLNEMTGSEIYRVPVTPPMAHYLGAQFFGDYMLAGYESGHIFCFDTRDGRLAWQTQINGGLWGFQSMDDSLFVTTHDARILKFSGDPSEPPETGTVKRKWQKPSGTFFRVSQSPRAKFELEAAKKTKSEQEKDFATTNADTARALVFKHCGRRIGKGLEGLTSLDECITTDLRAEERGIRLQVEPAPATIFLFGCLVGEILIELFGGRWVMIGEGDVAVDIPLGKGGIAQANVLGKVLKLFQNGLEDSTRFLADGIADQIAAQKSEKR